MYTILSRVYGVRCEFARHAVAAVSVSAVVSAVVSAIVSAIVSAMVFTTCPVSCGKNKYGHEKIGKTQPLIQ